MFMALSWRFGLTCFDTKNGWNLTSHSCALNVFLWSVSSDFDKRGERHITHSVCCRLFYELDTRVRHSESFQIQSLWKRPIHFNTLVFLTSLTYQSYNRCDTMRLKSIPRDKDTSLFFFLSFCSDKFCFLRNVFFFLISKPFFTWIPQLIACIFLFFFFVFLFCLVLCFCIKLEFLIFFAL